jgi:hypothetical protein
MQFDHTTRHRFDPPNWNTLAVGCTVFATGCPKLKLGVALKLKPPETI